MTVSSDFETRPAMVVLRALALGDLLTILPALRALRRAYPDHILHLTCPSWLKPLARAEGVLDVALSSAPARTGKEEAAWNPEDPHERIPLEIAQLDGLVGAPFEPDLAVNLRGERAATQAALLALRPRQLIAYRNDGVPETHGGPRWRRDEQEIEKWCRLLTESGIPTNTRDIFLHAPLPPVRSDLRGVVLIHPGAGSPARHWPLDRWASVAHALEGEGRRVYVTGGAGEVELAQSLCSLAGLAPERSLAGATDIIALAALVSNAALVLCPDTGLVHLAAATRTRCVAVYGPMPPWRWGPPSWLAGRICLWAGLRGDPYAPAPDPGLLCIEAEAVIVAAQRLCGW